jgi:cardiolipin synthase
MLIQIELALFPRRANRQLYPSWRKRMSPLTRTPFVPGNRVQLLINGLQSFLAMQSAIETERDRIEMESYEFNGASARQFSALLLQKQAQGVQVFLIYDAWGAMDTPASLFSKLRKAGVHVLEYSPFNPLKMTSLDLNKRDHRKMMIIDGKTALVGGVNVSPVYENRRRPEQHSKSLIRSWI